MAAYKGVNITPGTDDQIAQQMARIDAAGTAAVATPPPPANSMNAADLGKSQGTYSSWFPTPTAAPGLAETALSARNSILAGVAKETDVLLSDQATGRKGIMDIFKSISGQSAKRSDLYEKEGVNDLRREIDDIVSDMEARDRSYVNQIRRAELNPNGQLKDGVNIEVNNLEKSRASELADRAIVLSARTRNYETARSVIDQKINAETEDLRIQLEGYKFFYAENEANLSENRRLLLTQKIKDAEEELTQARELRSKIADLQLAAATNGAGASVVSQIGAAKDVNSAIQAMGQFAGDPLDRSLKLAQIGAANRSNRGGGGGGGGIDAYTDTESRAVYRAGIGGAPERVKEIFLAAPTGFRQAYTRNGFGNKDVTPDILLRNIGEWEAQNKDKDGDAELLQSVINAARESN